MNSLVNQVSLSTHALHSSQKGQSLCQGIDTGLLDRLPDELKLAVLARSDFLSLLALYDHSLWHDFVIETLGNSWQSVSFPPAITLDSLPQVVADIRARPVADRLNRNVRCKLLAFCDMQLLYVLEEDIHWHAAVLETLNRDYARVLTPFTPDPDGFRAMLRETGAIVSGSTALWFLLRGHATWTPGDMDLVTPYSTFDIVLEHVMSLPGAVGVYYQPDDYRLLPGYSRRRRIQTSGGYIDIVQSRTATPFTIVSGYWSTHVMNALTADAFWSAYPSHTVQMKGIYNNTPRGGCYTSAVEKHLERGFQISSEDSYNLGLDLTHTCDAYIGCPQRDRVWGDEFTLMLPLSHDSVEDFMKTLTGSFTAGWRLGAAPCGGARCLLSTEYRTYCLEWVD